MNTEVIFKPWYSGGTWLTNFHESERPLYDEAMEKTGDPDFVISNTACSTEWFTSEILTSRGMRSLHKLNPEGGASEFWKNFNIEKLSSTYP